MVPAIVLLDADGRPVRKTIQQNDARSSAQIRHLETEIDQELLYRKTGGRTNQQHILPRLLWVKETEPEVWEQTRTVMGSYDYVVYCLTGSRSLEVNWAVESGAYDIRSGKWLEEMLSAYGISTELFPKVRLSLEVAGLTKGLEDELGLPDGIPVIAGSADHVASTLAAGITKPGDLLIKFGGAGDILYCVDEIKTDPRLFFDYHVIPGYYLLNGCMAASGSLVKWFVKDIIQQDSPDIFRKLDQEAMEVPPGSGGLVILPYFLGEKTPIFDPEARGVMVGLTLSHTKAHIFRAILESVIYGFRHHVEILNEMGYQAEHIIATNGGAKSKFWCQIAADVLGGEVTSFRKHPGSSLGAAFLAGMQCGMFHDWEEIQKCLPESQLYVPDAEHVKVYDKSYQIYRDLYPRLQPVFHDLQGLP
jgi:xylulokinase